MTHGTRSVRKYGDSTLPDLLQVLEETWSSCKVFSSIPLPSLCQVLGLLCHPRLFWPVESGAHTLYDSKEPGRANVFMLDCESQIVWGLKFANFIGDL